jgi:transcription elongation factor GreA
MDKYYVTKEKLEDLKKELEYLKTVKRAEVAERLKQAKEFGDLSENSEYTDAKIDLDRTETRIFELEEMLKHISIIKKGAGGTSEVAIGSTVTIKKGTQTAQYQIVGSNEANPSEGKISNESPIGAAFLGKKVGDTVKVQTPAGTASYQITKIE